MSTSAPTRKTQRPLARGWLLLASAFCLSGCLSWTHSIDRDVHVACYGPDSAVGPASAPVVECGSNRVHVYFIHGLDPLDAANLRGVREFCHENGFTRTTLAQFYHGPEVARRICNLKACQPDARVLLFGFSAGTCTTRNIVAMLHNKHGIDVDTVIYTSGITLGNNDYSRPPYVGKVVHILDRGKIAPGTTLNNAENYKYSDVWHFGSPTHPQTLAVLLRELRALADDSAPVEAHSPLAPAQTTSHADKSRSVWDAVKPSKHLAEPPRFAGRQ